jgi:hypothetical protein
LRNISGGGELEVLRVSKERQGAGDAEFRAAGMKLPWRETVFCGWTFPDLATLGFSSKIIGFKVVPLCRIENF